MDAEEEGYVQVTEDDEGSEAAEKESADDEYDEEYDRQQFGIYQALPVPEGSERVCLKPEEATTVEEYLQAVRAQAAQCPQVVRVEHPTLCSAPATGDHLHQQHNHHEHHHESHHHHQQQQQQQQQSQGELQRSHDQHNACKDGRSGGDNAASTAEAAGGTQAAGHAEKDGASIAPPKPATHTTGKQPSKAAYISHLVAAHSTPSCPDWAKPSRRWLRQFVSEYTHLRQALAGLMLSLSQGASPPPGAPAPHDADAWERFLFGRPAKGCPSLNKKQHPDPGSSDAMEEDGKQCHLGGSVQTPPARPSSEPSGPPSQRVAVSTGAGVAGQLAVPSAASQSDGQKSLALQPLLPYVLHMDQVVIGRLLARHAAELSSASKLEALPAQWIYALGAALEKPVHSDVSATLRSLMKRVAVLRAGPLQGPQDPQVPLLNVVGAVAGAYFGQDAELLQLLSPEADMP